jgi:exodeoxyribonuclease V beta subunit
MSAPLQALTLPLQGHHLIEASAGTGKTWTIASLYLRMVLGLGTPQGRALHPRDILVLTFTRAATRELVDRIRSRLVQACEAFSGRCAPAADDDFLQALLASMPTGILREQATWRLEQAASAMDEAAVLTIDAWVQRLLNEHLLQPGRRGPEQILERDDAWVQAVVRDYWRQQVYPLDDAAMQAVGDVVGEPDTLARSLLDALHGPPPKPLSDGRSLQSALADIAKARALTLSSLKTAWALYADQIEHWFASRLQSNPKFFNGNRLKGGMKPVKRWCHQIRCWAAGPSAGLQGVNLGKPKDRDLRHKLTRAGLLQLHSKATVPADEHSLPPWCVAFERLVAELDQLPQVHSELMTHALAWVADALQRRKQQQSAYTFDDLLHQLTQGLHRQASVAHKIRQQFPVALVDEFQDTSPAQWALFERVYPDAASPDQALLLIGDPKQSIYAFRGADIHSYLNVRRRLVNRLHTLDCNRRSVPALVTALNTWVQGADRRPLSSPAKGAFLHGGEVPFLPVRSLGPIERLVCNGERLPVLCAWTQAQAGVAARGRQRDAARAAHQIAWLLTHPGVGFQAPGGSLRRLRPRDCCVLVRSRIEAQAMAQALRKLGCDSVYLSERDSVLESQEALDLFSLLQALLEPRRIESARRVWASASMGHRLGQLINDRADEPLWDARIRSLQACAARWAQEGVMSAVRHFIREEGLVSRAMASPGGERRLTNWLHLAEWLQAWGAQHHSPPALVRAYAQVMADPAAALQGTPGLREATLLRLESEADVVQIVTIHKSKGLQYPLVWLPFGVAPKPERESGRAHELVYEAGRWQVREPDGDPAAGEQNQAQPLQPDVMREDVRLLYVALTRAVHQLWLGAVPSKSHPNQAQNWHESALGHWVSGAGTVRRDEEVVQDLQTLWSTLHTATLAEEAGAGPLGWVHLETVDPEAERVWPADQGLPSSAPTPWPSNLPSEPHSRPVAGPEAGLLPEDSPPRAARRVLHPVQRSWCVASYSALARGAGEHLSPWRELRWDEEPVQVRGDPTSGLSGASAAGPWHTWPSSAAFGQLLHEALELGADVSFASGPDSPWLDEMRALLACSPWADQADAIESWLCRVVSQPFLPGGQSLNQLTLARAELEFWMPMQTLDTRAIDALLQQQLWPGEPRPALKPQSLEGLLMGFADLVFDSEGRFSVLDYKSNRLGDGPAHYSPAALRTTVLEHRYDLQAALYLLALHRLLGQRLGPAYRPQDHLGSAHFLFLRGIDQPDGHLLSIAPDAAWLKPLDQLMGSFAANTDAAGAHRSDAHHADRGAGEQGAR